VAAMPEESPMTPRWSLAYPAGSSQPLGFANLGWTIPRVRSSEQADRWTWLVLAAMLSACSHVALRHTAGCRGRNLWPYGQTSP
jgi:hypothetical protein